MLVDIFNHLFCFVVIPIGSVCFHFDNKSMNNELEYVSSSITEKLIEEDFYATSKRNFIGICFASDRKTDWTSVISEFSSIRKLDSSCSYMTTVSLSSAFAIKTEDSRHKTQDKKTWNIKCGIVFDKLESGGKQNFLLVWWRTWHDRK